MKHNFEDFYHYDDNRLVDISPLVRRWTIEIDILDKDIPMPQSMRNVFDELLNKGMKEYSENYIKDWGVEPVEKDITCSVYLNIEESNIFEYFLCVELKCRTNYHTYGSETHNIGSTEEKLCEDAVKYVRELFESGKYTDTLYDIRLNSLPVFINGYQWYDVSFSVPVESNKYLAVIDKNGVIYGSEDEGSNFVFFNGEFCDEGDLYGDDFTDEIKDEVRYWRYLDD